MNVLLITCLLGLVALSAADTKTHSRGCIYILGKCSRECPEGTHAYALGCGHKIPEATCDEPNPVVETATICDYSSCYCDPPTLRDTESKKCVPVDQCPNKKEGNDTQNKEGHDSEKKEGHDSEKKDEHDSEKKDEHDSEKKDEHDSEKNEE